VKIFSLIILYKSYASLLIMWLFFCEAHPAHQSAWRYGTRVYSCTLGVFIPIRPDFWVLAETALN